MTVVLMVGLTVTSSANTYKFNGKCQYNGSKITSNFSTEEFAASQDGMEPGDSLTYKVTYKNNSDKKTSWYMRNKVLETLEENKSQAENGGYTYVLKNIGPNGTETTLFDNSQVGGETKKGKLEGLLQATNATGNFFFIQDLKPGESATTYLHVAMDGETEVNDYMDTHGELMVSYAVEDQDGKTDEQKDNNPRTGDPMSIWKFIALMAAAVAVAIFAIISWRRDRKDGEQA